MTKIEDFGQKIGGARKDLWSREGLVEDDLYKMNDDEKKLYVTRDNVWPLKDAKKLVESGIPAFVVYWQRAVRRETYKQPVIYASDDFNGKVAAYVKDLTDLKNRIMNVQSIADILNFHKEDSRISNRWPHCIASYTLGHIYTNLSWMQRKCSRTGFPETKLRKKAETKKSFLPPQLSHIEREGTDYRGGININPSIWQEEFEFRGVEFGNWMSQKDRQASMNFCYDALLDMADALGIESRDIAFSGKLALAFGARGTSQSRAHYEPLRKVINLTKMHGAGSTAHEWFHALDHMLAEHTGSQGLALASELKDQSGLPESFQILAKAVKKDSDGKFTDFYRGSKKFDGFFRKESQRFWSSTPEMLARAFACYVKDCIGCKSDYLIAHADVYKFEYENQSISAIPQDDEREYFNELFDNLFAELKEIGFLHQSSYEERNCLKDVSPVPVIPADAGNWEEEFVEMNDGQFRLCL